MSLLIVLLGECAYAGTDEVSLGHSERLWLLWLVPVLIVLFVFAARMRANALARFASHSIIKRLTGRLNPIARRLKQTMVLGAVVAMVLALVDIKIGYQWEEVKRKGVDLVIALDVSDSMLVKDGDSSGGLNRLERARRELSDLLNRMNGDRVGLVAFAGEAYLQCPLTLDYGAADLFLRDFDTELIPVKGTAIGKALRTAKDALEASPESSKAVLLITDGEDHSGEAIEAAKELAEAGIRVFVIGIGNERGAPIPSSDGQGAFRRDAAGQLVMSKLDEGTLQSIALETGGRYVRSVTGDMDLQSIYEEGIKRTVVAAELSQTRRRRWQHRFQWFAAIALLLLLIEPFVPEQKKGA